MKRGRKRRKTKKKRKKKKRKGEKTPKYRGLSLSTSSRYTAGPAHLTSRHTSPATLPPSLPQPHYRASGQSPMAAPKCPGLPSRSAPTKLNTASNCVALACRIGRARTPFFHPHLAWVPDPGLHVVLSVIVCCLSLSGITSTAGTAGTAGTGGSSRFASLTEIGSSSTSNTLGPTRRLLRPKRRFLGLGGNFAASRGGGVRNRQNKQQEERSRMTPRDASFFFLIWETVLDFRYLPQDAELGLLDGLQSTRQKEGACGRGVDA